MATKKAGFAEILIRQGTISADQLAEAQRVSKTSGKKVQDQLVVLGYATGDEVMRAPDENFQRRLPWPKSTA